MKLDLENCENDERTLEIEALVFKSNFYQTVFLFLIQMCH